MQIHTYKIIATSKTDIVMKDKKLKTCALINMAMPPGRNPSVKVIAKMSKHKDLEIEIQRMWGM